MYKLLDFCCLIVNYSMCYVSSDVQTLGNNLKNSYQIRLKELKLLWKFDNDRISNCAVNDYNTVHCMESVKAMNFSIILKIILIKPSSLENCTLEISLLFLKCSLLKKRRNVKL